MGIDDAARIAASETVTLVELQREVSAFYRVRDWEKFQTLKDLAAGISIEAAELQQLFLWREGSDSQTIFDERRAEIEEEFADVFIHCLNFARQAELDIEAVVRHKLAVNDAKYPVAKVKGRVVPHQARNSCAR